ncbi:MAG: hypothetical protein LKF33_08545 [Prevotella sp.]|jgi:hypothetical protein|nr:hypothetical protein [Prevotella sp.]
MKKILLVLLMSISTVCSFGQYKDNFNISYEGCSKDSLIKCSLYWGGLKYDGLLFEKNKITLFIVPDSFSNFWEISIDNASDNNIKIKWNDAKIGGRHLSNVVFGETMRNQIDEPIKDEIIYSGTKSDSHTIGGRYYATSSINLEMVDHSQLKKYARQYKDKETTDIRVIIPIEVNNNIELFDFTIVASYIHK